MPSLEHNGLVEMFRDNPALAPHLLETLFHLDLPAHAAVTVGETALDQLLPIEYRADLVLELRDAAGALVLAIVLEVQRDEDADKKYTLPVYVTVVRGRKRCPAIVLVVAPNPKVAVWAAGSIDLGLGLGTVKPLVLGPAIVPVVTDEAEAMREAERSVLSAVKVSYPRSLQRLVEGGRREGMHEGELEARRKTLLRLLRRTGITFTPEDEARGLARADAEMLDRWVDSVLTAKTIGEVLT